MQSLLLQSRPLKQEGFPFSSARCSHCEQFFPAFRATKPAFCWCMQKKSSSFIFFSLGFGSDFSWRNARRANYIWQKERKTVTRSSFLPMHWGPHHGVSLSSPPCRAASPRVPGPGLACPETWGPTGLRQGSPARMPHPGWDSPPWVTAAGTGLRKRVSRWPPSPVAHTGLGR